MTEQVSQSDNQRLVINTVGRNHYFHHAYADDHFCFTDDDLPELLEFCASHSNFPKEIPSAKSCEPCEPCRYIDEESETPCTQRGINLILKSAEWAKRQKEIPAVKPFPNSTQLIEMAHTDWKNREERKHNHDEQDWCSGWISGWFAGAGWNPAATQNPCPFIAWDQDPELVSGEYQCEIGGKTSSEKCECKETWKPCIISLKAATQEGDGK